MDMEYIYEQSEEPPPSPPPPYSSLSRRPSRPRSPRRNPAVAVYIPSGAPPQYSCKMSPTIETAESRRESLNSVTTLTNEADLCPPPRLARLDKPPHECGTSSTRSNSPASGETMFYDALPSPPEPEVGQDARQQDSAAKLAVAVHQYEVLLAANRSLLDSYRLVTKRLETELLHTRDLELRARRLRLEAQAKERQVAAREVRVKELEEKFHVRREERPDGKSGSKHGEEACGAREKSTTAGKREEPMVERPPDTMRECAEAVVCLFLFAVMIYYLCKASFRMVRALAA
ncbi:hypothetical protein IWZ03DRAFT_427708 [Phyllosticta citriasiana]|uniref:Uncharacterized protein n=1 Tax=Phyllosticta citriasiana TaxID=595635 RepID=A0ABR1KWS0_9PEZI